MTLGASLTSPIIAQQELSLHFVNNVWQSNFTNPAFQSEKGINILLPSIYYNVNSQDVTVGQLFKANTQGTKLTFSDLADRVQAQNRFDANVNIQSFGLAINASKRLSINAYHSVNISPSLDINGNLVKLIGKGNAQFLGQTIPLNSAVNGSVYSELGVGLSYMPKDHIKIGGRVKLLKGVSAIFTEKGQQKTSFDKDDYSLTFENDFNVLTYSYDQLKDIKSPTDALNQSFNGKNSGLSFDLGTTIKLGKIQIAASAIDLGGSIKWQNDGKSYASKGSFKYSGINSDNFYNLDSLSSSSFKDTLKNVISLKETDNPQFTQKLPTKIYLSATYQLTPKMRVGALVFNENGGLNVSRTNLILNAQYELAKALQVGASVGLRNSSVANIGIQTVLKLGPIQIYALTDNILGVIKPDNVKSFNGRIGMNIMFWNIATVR